MTLRNQIENSLKEAMKAGNEARKRTIRLILAAVKLAEVDRGAQLDDDALLAVIQKEVKIRKEAIDGAQQAGRQDLLEQAQTEIAILEEFLPGQLSDAQLVEMARQAIQETGAASAADLGRVMKILMPRLKGQATGERAGKVVRDLLNPPGS